MRCTVGESRLSTLALMHIKYDMRIMPVNLDEIVNLSFIGLYPRMMQFTQTKRLGKMTAVCIRRLTCFQTAHKCPFKS